MKIKTIFIILLGMLFASSALASVRISPMVVKLNNNKQRATVNLENTGNKPLVFKAGIAQKVKGKFVAKNNIIVVPKVVKIKPRSKKAVRFALRSKVKKADKYYLTLLRKAKPHEIKLAVAKGKVRPNVSLNVQLNIPVLVAPKAIKAKKKLASFAPTITKTKNMLSLMKK